MRQGYQEILRVEGDANDPALQEYILRARQDVRAMLEGQPPQAGADYGPWMPQMMRLMQAFEQEGSKGVQYELAVWLYYGGKVARVLLDGAVTPSGMPWDFALALRGSEIGDEIERAENAKREAAARHQMAERRAAAERRMRERLSRTTGDSMADEILAMLREQELSRTDIYRRYSRNVSAERINDALFVLERLGWACWKTVSTGGRGREVWYLPPDEE